MTQQTVEEFCAEARAVIAWISARPETNDATALLRWKMEAPDVADLGLQQAIARRVSYEFLCFPPGQPQYVTPGMYQSRVWLAGYVILGWAMIAAIVWWLV
jgi:hypothetical protein